jgi:hypothetical protein
MPPPPVPTPIYHITHVANLARILAEGGLLCCNLIRQRGVAYQNIAFETVQDRRARKIVPCGPGGNLHDYVPFYFGPRSPMLYTLSRGNVPGHTGGQRPVVHLVSFTQVVYTANRPAVFTDGHGIMDYTGHFTDPAHLGRIDWPLMTSRWWNPTIDDPDRRRRRQAEFLVHQQVPWGLITGIGVLDEQMQALVEQVLRGASHRPAVTVQRAWYY